MTTDKELNYQIGNRIREAREAAGITQEKLAAAIGMSVNHISDVERGISGTSVPTIKNICETLHVSCDYIIMGRKLVEGQPIHIVEFFQGLSPSELELSSKILKLVIEKSFL